MKQLKIAITLILTISLLIPAMNSCKKGEGDPILSLRSRKSRVVGEWKIEEWTEESSNNGTSISNGSSYTNSGSYTGKMQDNNYTYSSSSTYSGNNVITYSATGSGSASAEMTFKKDGTFIRTMNYTNINSTVNDDIMTYTSTRSETVTTSGTWNFLGRIENEFDNKERIILNIMETFYSTTYSDSEGESYNGTQTYNYANGEYSEVWHLNTLKHKEMVIDATMTSSGTGNSTSSNNGNTDTYSNTNSMTGTIEGKLVLK